MKVLLACVTASVAAVLTACGTQTAGETTLAPLRLSDAGVNAQVALAPGTVDNGTGFELRTTLPTATPDPAPVYRLPHATAAGASLVAGALGVPGTPTAITGGWVIRYGGQRLAVRSDGGWYYGMDCSPNVPVQQESLDVMCASASGGGVAIAVPAPAGTPGKPGGPVSPYPSPTPPTPPPTGPTAAQARALAAPILSRLGWADSTVDTSVGSPATSVTARRVVDGQPTADWTTTLSFASPDKLVDGSGFVGQPTRGRAYPLISADRAYKALLATPRAMPEICQVRKDGKPGCAPIPPTVITAATLGLALRHDLDKPLLVPAWLFTVKGSSQPLAVVAVDPRYVRPPATVVPRPLPPQSVNPAGPADGSGSGVSSPKPAATPS